MTLIYDHSSGSCTGLKFRKPTLGPEYSMVLEFIGQSLPEPSLEQDLIVLIEPKFSSGVPDLVAVYWNKSRLSQFSHRKISLDKKDVKILQYIIQSEKITIEEIIVTFGKNSKKSVEKLTKEKFIYKKGNFLIAYSKVRQGVVDRIITVEAKMHDWKGGIRQASNHFWLGEETYLLMMYKNFNEKIATEAEARGVGVLFSGQSVKVDHSPMRSTTYGYWMINEMILLTNGAVA